MLKISDYLQFSGNNLKGVKKKKAKHNFDITKKIIRL